MQQWCQEISSELFQLSRNQGIVFFLRNRNCRNSKSDKYLSLKDQFKFRHHSAYLVSISKQPDIKIVTNKTGVIISMINNQYGFIKFGDSGETALFCCKSLFKEGWQFSGDPLKLPAMKFDGYQIPGG